MPETLKRLRIFAASPSDVASERAKLETVVDSLKPMADYLGLTLEVVDWRTVVPDAGRPQQVIFDQLKPTTWDIFIGVLWHRFGTPPGATDKIGKEFLSGTEEEFYTAYELWKKHSKPRMVLYRCTRALPFDVDPDQLKNVRAFFKLIEDVKGDYPTLYQAFDTTELFEKLVFNNLQKLLVTYGEEAKKPITPEVEQNFAPKIPNNLPRRQAFFGRTKEMDTVMRALNPADRTWGVLVDGIGGIGKSAIAIEAAYQAQEKGMFESFVFVTAKTNILEPSGIKELNPPARTLDEFLNETARVLGETGVTKLAGIEKRRALINALGTMRTLLVYDNLETLSIEEQEGVADFLRELQQGCKAIITSRRRGGEGAIWLRLEKLDWDAARRIIKNEMSRDAGLANKLNQVGESHWLYLFEETNGSPLALLHTLGLMRVRASLTFNGALEILRGNRDEDLRKFVFQEAQKELSSNDKLALGALSFFSPSATFESWMEVANLSRNALETTIDRLNALSLVDILSGGERYALHPLTRIYVREELLSGATIARERGMRFIKYWIDYIKQFESEIKNYKKSDSLENEMANLDAAVNCMWEIVNPVASKPQDKNVIQILLNAQELLKDFSLSTESVNEVENLDFTKSGLLFQLHIFTPRGEIVELPLGATPIDFAYQVHTDIGHRCRGARVNGKLVPLYQELKTGDQVEILTAKQGGPSRDWLNPNLGLVKTQKARSRIKHWFKRQEDEQNIAQGHSTLERELQRLGIFEMDFDAIAHGVGLKTPNELFIAIGCGDLSVNRVIRLLSETNEVASKVIGNTQVKEPASAEAIEVVGLKGLLSSMAKCCNPVPGDKIIGYITRGRGATIHRQDCPNILYIEDKERFLQVEWGKNERTFLVPIKVHAYDRQGLMSDIANLLTNENINIDNLSVNVNQSLTDIRLTIEVKDLPQLSRILTRIENLPNVLEAVRVGISSEANGDKQG